MTLVAKWIYQDGKFVTIEWVDSEVLMPLPQIDHNSDDSSNSDAA